MSNKRRAAAAITRINDEISRVQADAHLEAATEGTLATIDSKVLACAAKAAYDRFVREAGYEHDARIKEWEKLNYTHQRRWAAIARAVIEVSRGADGLGGAGDVHIAHERDGKLRHRVGGAAAQKPSDRNRGARRKS